MPSPVQGLLYLTNSLAITCEKHSAERMQAVALWTLKVAI